MLSAKGPGKEQPHRGVGGNTIGTSSSPDLPAAGMATMQPRQGAQPLPRKGGQPIYAHQGRQQTLSWVDTLSCV